MGKRKGIKAPSFFTRIIQWSIYDRTVQEHSIENLIQAIYAEIYRRKSMKTSMDSIELPPTAKKGQMKQLKDHRHAQGSVRMRARNVVLYETNLANLPLTALQSR